MEKRSLVLALALTLPLALYGIPYAYAAQTTSTYVLRSSQITVVAGDENFGTVTCHSGDYATGGGFNTAGDATMIPTASSPSNSTGFPTQDDETPTSWTVVVKNTGPGDGLFRLRVVCQTPVIVAGVTVPEFGSLYAAIALGAVVFFMLSRHYTKTNKISRSQS